MTAAVDLAALAVSDVPAVLLARLRAARHVLAVSHENPDADTLGAVLGVCAIVDALGGHATAISTDPPPPLYAFMPGVERFRTDPDPSEAYDLLVIADCTSVSRVGGVAERHAALFASLPLVIIDHHASNDATGDDHWIDAASAATCEQVALLAVRMGVPLAANDGALAAVLMAGIVMDTATFAHPNTTPRTLAVAAALVAAGAPLSDISRRLYRTKPDAQLRLFGRVLDRLATAANRRVIWSTLLDADFAATETIAAHSEGIIDLLAQSDTAEVAMLFKEQPDGTTRLSVRTKAGGVDATVLTAPYGGGGHTRAAGASVPLGIAAAIDAVMPAAQRLADAVVR
jgi:bifunctional oligoribonuclease and PAP phosphatase NrnA